MEVGGTDELRTWILSFGDGALVLDIAGGEAAPGRILTACAPMLLLTGASGLALGLPGNFRRKGMLRRGGFDTLPFIDGRAVVLA